jgi:hypothetical protein
MILNQNNQFNNLNNNQSPQANSFFISIKNWFVKHKKWFLLSLIIMTISVLFTVYYVYWAKSYVYFTADPQNIKLTIDGKDYQVKDHSLIGLKPGVYTISASKDGYMTYNNFINIKPLRFSRQTIKLSDIFYAGAVASNSNSESFGLNQDAFISYWQADQSLVYYSSDANAFYKIKLVNAQKTYQAPNTIGEKIIDIKLDSSQSVSSVIYSPDGSKSLAVLDSKDKNQIKMVDFSASLVQNLSSDIIYATWLTNDQILALKSNNQLIILNSSLNEIKNAGNLTTLSLPYAFNAQKVLLASLDNDDKYILDLNSGQKTKVDLAGSIINFSASGNQAIAQIQTSDNQTKNYLLSQDGLIKELNLSSTGLVWYSDHQILYTEAEKDNNYVDFKLYDVASKQFSVIKNYFSSGASIDAVIFSPSNIFFISVGQIMGFKK